MQLSTERFFMKIFFLYKYIDWMYFSHRLQCKIKSEINQTQIKILKIPMVGYFYLIYPSKWYHVYKNPTIHLRDMKYGRYTLNTLTQDLTKFIFRVPIRNTMIKNGFYLNLWLCLSDWSLFLYTNDVFGVSKRFKFSSLTFHFV
jgi:hypothetical protein